MIVLDAVRDPEACRRAKIAALEDDALREDDSRIRFGARDGIPDGAAFHLDVITAFHARLDAIEGEIVRRGVGSVHLRPRPAEDRPRAADLASEQHLNGGALFSLLALIDQDKGLAVALVDRAGPVGVDGEVEPIQFDVTGGALLDVPRPAPIAVARDEDVSVETPALCHVTLQIVADDRWATHGCQGRRNS